MRFMEGLRVLAEHFIRIRKGVLLKRLLTAVTAVPLLTR